MTEIVTCLLKRCIVRNLQRFCLTNSSQPIIQQRDKVRRQLRRTHHQPPTLSTMTRVCQPVSNEWPWSVTRESVKAPLLPTGSDTSGCRLMFVCSQFRGMVFRL
ncbi:hypothetical protein J6590_094020 [Homalodisca vitripennis]|nr:hypothetical protein J6590_094020 [Homalodisca vitripennis]